jgi:ABC-type anion transport system duplicated permease subunit
LTPAKYSSTSFTHCVISAVIPYHTIGVLTAWSGALGPCITARYSIKSS